METPQGELLGDPASNASLADNAKITSKKIRDFTQWPNDLPRIPLPKQRPRRIAKFLFGSEANCQEALSVERKWFSRMDWGYTEMVSDALDAVKVAMNQSEPNQTIDQ